MAKSWNKMAPKVWPEAARLGAQNTPHAVLNLAERIASGYYNVHIQSVI